MRPTNLKTEESAKLNADIESFLNSGGEIKQLPSFGARPTGVDYTPENQYKIRQDELARMKFNNRNEGRVNNGNLPAKTYAAIDDMILEGLPLITIARKVGVSARTVKRRKDKLDASR